MSAIIISADGENDQVRLLRRLLGEVGVRSTVAPTLDANAHAASQSIVFVPDIYADPALADWMIALAEQWPNLFFVYVADDMTADGYKRLIRTGAADWIKWQTLTIELIEVLRRRRGGGGAEATPHAAIVSVLPVAGGVGASTIALETAVLLASTKQKGRGAPRTAILDLNLQQSAYPEYLDIDARFDINEVIGHPERLDGQLIDLFASKHASGVHIFCAPPSRFDFAAIDDAVLFRVLDEIAKRYDIIILDLPAVWFSWRDNILVGSDLVCLVCGFSIPSVKRSARILKQVEELGVAAEKLAVVVNRFERSWFGGTIERSDVTGALQGPAIHFIHRDDAAASEAVNTGQSILRSRRSRRIRKDIALLVRWIEKARPEVAA